MNQNIQKLLAGTIHRMAVYIRSHYRTGKKVLREKQMNVFEAVHSFLKKNLTSGFIKLPTGTGKTVLFGQIIRVVANHKSRAIILVPRIQLVQQTYESLKNFAPKLSVGRINVDYKEYDHQVIITTYASWQIQLKSGGLSIDEFDYIILDEGHRALTSNLKAYIESAKKKSIVLGFTATPGFSSRKHLKKLLQHEVCTMELSEAIHLGLLSGVRVMLVEVDVDLSETASKRGDYDTKDLEMLINTSKINNTALEVYQNYFDGECAIIYANSIQHVHDVVATFGKSGIKARGIHGGLSKKKREEILRDYHFGKFNVLVNCDLLIEGFDEPRVSVCLNLRPTQSVVLAEQRGGRALRIDPANPNKTANVVDFIYRESARRAVAVLFSQVTGGAIILPENVRLNKNMRTGRVWDSRDLLDIEGVKIIYDVHTVDELTKDRANHNKRFTDSFYGTWQEASRVAIELGIRNHPKYLKRYKEDPRLPSTPVSVYKDFPGYRKFFGTDRDWYSTWEQASSAAKKLGIKSIDDYRVKAKKDPRLYSIPQKIYSNFPGWTKFLTGEEKSEKYKTWQEASKAAQKLGIKRGIDYKKKYHKDPRLPWLPYEYPDFPGFTVFLGGETIEKYPTWQKASMAAMDLGIKDRINYVSKKKYLKDLKLPANPHVFYSNFPGWTKFLTGKKEIKKYKTWEQASGAAKKLGIKSKQAYVHRGDYKQDPRLPSSPHTFYKNFPGWPKFLGKE